MDQQQTTSYAHRSKFLQLTGTSDTFHSCVILWQDQCYSARFHCWITETFGLPLFESGSTAGTQGDGADDGEDAADDDDDEQQQHLQSGVRSIYMTSLNNEVLGPRIRSYLTAARLYKQTRSSATADGPRDALCQSKSCQLLHNCKAQNRLK